MKTTAKKVRQFADRVRGELARRKIKQADLAYFLGITQPALSAKLAGKTEWSLRDYLNICEFFNWTGEE